MFKIYIFIILLLLYSTTARAESFTCEASYYTVASCIKESGQSIMANGKPLVDSSLICASWDYPFGTRLVVYCPSTNKTVTVTMSDRGPSKRLYRRGRRIDLSEAAFKRLAPLSRGIIQVEVNEEVLNEPHR